MTNPFNAALDYALRGRQAIVTSTDGKQYSGWINRIHHHNASVLLHDARDEDTGMKRGSVFIREVADIAAVKARKKIRDVAVDDLHPHPSHAQDFELNPHIVRAAYRDRFTGSFPVVSEDFTIINGHKRISAARAAGLTHHPVQVIPATREETDELYELAHVDDESSGGEVAGA